ncbi:odontogenic ameloblast-associated protein [Erinaceus europaeus]|uniref:Odontogenic ameloblast-associated protein n=1 Tax=Erinaceus europaeus TaxID=9365 RepID=A0A1S2ZRW9_ERIEU|nr:odontogenic ameloblast-associated protein [Erinaceus europaeus]
MRIIIILGLMGATVSAPLIPQQRLMSASHSHELLLNLNNGQLLPLQLQGPFNSWIPPFSGISQQQLQAKFPGFSQFSSPALDRFARLFPNQASFPGQVSLPRGTQAGQLDPSQPQTVTQTPQNPNQALPYLVSFKVPQEQTQMLQYHPVYMLLPWEQPLPTGTQSPPQTGQQQFEEQMPFYTQFGYIPQQVEPVIPGGQQPVVSDPFMGIVPETFVMPAGGVIPYLQKEINFKHASSGISIPSTTQNPSTTKLFAPAVDPAITPELMEEKGSSEQDENPLPDNSHPGSYCCFTSKLPGTEIALLYPRFKLFPAETHKLATNQGQLNEPHDTSAGKLLSSLAIFRD